ncbi:MAG: Dabb family protein [Phycisphaerales bacterium]
MPTPLPRRLSALLLCGAAAAVPFYITGCSETLIRGSTASGVPLAPPVTHVVLITLQDPAQAAELIADCNARLPQIREIRLYSVGTPFEAGRANVDSSWTVGLTLGFEDGDAYRRYLDHPIHKELVAKWQPRWSQARIFDIGMTGAAQPR